MMPEDAMSQTSDSAARTAATAMTQPPTAIEVDQFSGPKSSKLEATNAWMTRQ